MKASIEQINVWLNSRFDQIEKCPKMYGNSAQIESCYVSFLETWAMVNFSFDGRQILSEYNDFVNKNYQLNTALSSQIENENDMVYILKFFREFLEKKFNASH